MERELEVPPTLFASFISRLLIVVYSINFWVCVLATLDCPPIWPESSVGRVAGQQGRLIGQCQVGS